LRPFHPIASARFASVLHPIGAVFVVLFGAPGIFALALLHGAGNGLITIAKGTLPLALFAPHGYWSVSTCSPSNIGFALRNTIRTRVADCRSRYGDEGMAAAMKVVLVARNGTRVGPEPDRRHLYRQLYLCWWRKLQVFLKLGPPRWNGWQSVVRGWLCGVSGRQPPGS
jgi:hypothetical protein